MPTKKSKRKKSLVGIIGDYDFANFKYKNGGIDFPLVLNVRNGKNFYEEHENESVRVRITIEEL